MLILGIETSCDETAAALVNDGEEVLANVVSSQIELHGGYGGVVPELAAREHVRNLDPVVEQALAESDHQAKDIDAVAVTAGPGLAPALLVGICYAKGFALAGNLPLVGVDHFTAHIYSCLMDNPEIRRRKKAYPMLALVVSGGHTTLVLIKNDGEMRIVGETIDDAAGEAFDKGGKILGLAYPGGPLIERLAKKGDREKFRFPRGLTGAGGKKLDPENRYNFSFSGVKTALLYKVDPEKKMTEQERADLAASYQEAIIEVLIKKTAAAAAEFEAPTVLLSGGVASNRILRQRMKSEIEGAGRSLLIPPPPCRTDNAAMVAALAWHELKLGRKSDLNLNVYNRIGSSLVPAAFVPR